MAHWARGGRAQKLVEHAEIDVLVSDDGNITVQPKVAHTMFGTFAYRSFGNREAEKWPQRPPSGSASAVYSEHRTPDWFLTRSGKLKFSPEVLNTHHYNPATLKYESEWEKMNIPNNAKEIQLWNRLKA